MRLPPRAWPKQHGSICSRCYKTVTDCGRPRRMRYRLWSASVLSIALAGCPDSQKHQQARQVPAESVEEVIEPVLANDPRFTDPTVSAADIAGAYKKFRRMTPREGVAVNPGLAML